VADLIRSSDRLKPTRSGPSCRQKRMWQAVSHPWRFGGASKREPQPR